MRDNIAYNISFNHVRAKRFYCVKYRENGRWLTWTSNSGRLRCFIIILLKVQKLIRNSLFSRECR